MIAVAEGWHRGPSTTDAARRAGRGHGVLQPLLDKARPQGQHAGRLTQRCPVLSFGIDRNGLIPEGQTAVRCAR